MGRPGGEAGAFGRHAADHHRGAGEGVGAELDGGVDGGGTGVVMAVFGGGPARGDAGVAAGPVHVAGGGPVGLAARCRGGEGVEQGAKGCPDAAGDAAAEAADVCGEPGGFS